MKYFQSFILFTFLALTNHLLYGQLGEYNCANPKLVEVPFKDGGGIIADEEIHYESNDKYTYWYEIRGVQNCVLSYKKSLINKDDDYEFFLYKNTETNFCNNLLNNKIMPFSIEKEGELELKKGESVFFNVISINGSGCGHFLDLLVAGSLMKIKAIQNECVEDILDSTDVQIGSIITEVITPEVINEISPEVETKKSISGLVINEDTKLSIDAQVLILATDNRTQKLVRSVIGQGFVLHDFDHEKLNVSVKKFGYKTFNGVVEVVSGKFQIALKPLGVGGKLVMKKVYFHPNTYVLKDESKRELNKLLSFVLENKTKIFEIQGHTNGNRFIKRNNKFSHLGEGWNFKGSSKKLSKLRAESIKSYLVKNGVDESQLRTLGFGGDRMVVSKPKSLKQAMKNIRVEIAVVE